MKILIRNILILILISAFSPKSEGQLVQMNLRLKNDTILIGQQTLLQMVVLKNQDVRILNFSLRDSLPKDIEIIDSLTQSSGDTLRYALKITSFSPGEIVIPQFPLSFEYNGKTDTLFSTSQILTVLSPQIDQQAQIRDIKPLLTLPFKLSEIIPETALILGILLVLGILIYYFLRRRHKRKEAELEYLNLPAHIKAINELNRLKEEKLWQKGRVKDYYSQLSDIMRVYLENRFGIQAMEFVSSETLKAFSKTMPEEEMLYEMLEGILTTADMVKFAKEDPLPAINQGNMDNAYLFIGQTKIEEPKSIDEKQVEMEKNNNTDKS
ncbi:MAG: hypothetical protein H7A26_08985 [Spirochaetales bacterium]|nr:hypothetical protein [Spirochaetales bacterium]